MKSESLEKTEAECAEGRTAPRVSLYDIKNAINSAYYTTGMNLPNHAGEIKDEDGQSLSVLTICLVVMKNGFTM